MAVQSFEYKKISALPATTQLGDNDVFIVNHNAVTSKITFKDMMTIINTKVTHDLTTILQRLTAVESAVSGLGTRVTDAEGTIDNIIAAGFNLIGIE